MKSVTNTILFVAFCAISATASAESVSRKLLTNSGGNGGVVTPDPTITTEGHGAILKNDVVVTTTHGAAVDGHLSNGANSHVAENSHTVVENDVVTSAFGGRTVTGETGVLSTYDVNARGGDLTIEESDTGAVVKEFNTSPGAINVRGQGSAINTGVAINTDRHRSSVVGDISNGAGSATSNVLTTEYTPYTGESTSRDTSYEAGTGVATNYHVNARNGGDLSITETETGAANGEFVYDKTPGYTDYVAVDGDASNINSNNALTTSGQGTRINGDINTSADSGTTRYVTTLTGPVDSVATDRTYAANTGASTNYDINNQDGGRVTSSGTTTPINKRFTFRGSTIAPIGVFTRSG